MVGKRETGSERKRRPDAWEVRAGLSEAELHRVFNWARALGYARCRELIREELEQEPPSQAALAGWYEFYSGIEARDLVHKAIVDGAAIRELAAAGGDVSEAMCAALEAEASAAILSQDPERIKLLVSLALKARQSRFDERRYKDAMKSRIEQGLDALADQAQGNADALHYYELFRTAVLEQVEAAA